MRVPLKGSLSRYSPSTSNLIFIVPYVPFICLIYPLIHPEYVEFRKLLVRTASSTVATGAVLSANSLLPSHSSRPEELWLDDISQSLIVAQFALRPLVIHKAEYLRNYFNTIL